MHRSQALALTAIVVGLLAPSGMAAASSPPPGAAHLALVRHAPALSLSGLSVSPSDVTSMTFDRIAGSTRYDTAVAVSKVMFPDTPPVFGDGSPVKTVYIASGQNFPDALAAGPLVSGTGALLLVPSAGTVPAGVLAEVRRYAPDDVVVLGGTGAVSAGVRSEIKGAAPGAVLTEISASNRYGTAAAIATADQEAWVNTDGKGLDVVYLVSGETYADALAAGGAAANTRGALLLTHQASLPPESLAALTSINPPRVSVVGGTGAVSAAVMTSVQQALPEAAVTRLAGADRFATAVAVSSVAFPGGTALTADGVFLTYGYNFPDALAAAPLAGGWRASTLLTRATCMTAATRAEVVRLNPSYVTAIGGTGVVSDAALHLVTC